MAIKRPKEATERQRAHERQMKIIEIANNTQMAENGHYRNTPNKANRGSSLRLRLSGKISKKRNLQVGYFN